MSGFLARLAERAVGTARTVQPRLPARFEGGGGWVVAEGSDGDPAEGRAAGGEADAARVPAAAASAGEQIHQGSEGPPRAAPRSPPAAAASGNRESDLPSPRVPSAEAPVASRGEAAPPPLAPIDPPRRHERPAEPATQGAEPLPRHAPPASAAAPAHPPADGPPVVHVETRRRAPSSPLSPPSERPTPDAPSQRHPPLEPLPPSRRADAAAAEDRHQPLETSAADAPPAIRISIGRVEVRAVAPERPAARPAPRRPAEPRLSLEEYQRRRRESLR
ncbi:MAG TPA: hypothetical protein VKU40_08590 [Thermoanaerobaculia bacterium]|nr:hypothetical protein [Thermoanaerobaculia bacterium]